jgi:site-specific DNA-methyltransferase (adenine-specific)
MIDLRHQDCMEYMATLPDKAFDLAIVDPPYGIGKRILGTWGKKTGMNEAVKWDKAPGEDYFSELFRVSRDQIIWGANYFVKHIPASMGWISWDKMNGTNNLSDFELAFTSFQDKTARRFSMHHFSAGYDPKIHPTQKPVALYRWLLKNYAKPGQRILDTHLGSGSIAIACDIEGFDLVGCEIDADYIAGARKRLADHQAQPRLFDAPPTEQPVQLQMVQ